MVGTKVRQYQIVEKLAKSGMGEVYRARDDRLHRDVVIKFLPERFTGQPAAVKRFVREARAASALNHPNIVTIFDSGKAKGGLFIIMELIRGRTLREWAGKDIATATLLQIISQTAKALSAAHAAGIVHRDIKPENIMLRDDGYIKVLDFGLASWEQESLDGATPPTTRTASGTFLGTLRYMSPEQAAGQRLSASSDIFSLGIVLYELVTGKHPFEARSELETLQAITSSPVRSPCHWAPELSPSLEHLILRMLDRNDRLRPSAVEIIRLLEEISERGALPMPVPETESRQPLVGRHNELVKLRALLDSTSKGHGLLVLITGEPGIGKTSLVEGFLGEQAASQRSCAVGRGFSSERLSGAEAYLPLFEALEDLVRGTPSLAPIMRRVAPNWYEQVMRDSSGQAAPGQLKAASRELLKRELAAFLEEASFVVPLILFLDDLHWADESTVDLLAHLSTHLGSTPILIFASYRPEEMQLRHEGFSQIVFDLQARKRCRTIDLGFLSLADVGVFISLEFPQNAFPDTFPNLIHAKTEGNPFFMVEVLRYLRDKHVISQKDETWTLSETLPEIERDLPQSVSGMVQRKINILTEHDRRLLGAASVQGFEFDSPVVAKTVLMEAADVEERLDRLHRVHGFVQPVGEKELPIGTIAARYRFVHFLYYGAFYNAIQPARKASWSSAAASALMHFHEGHTAEIAGQIALLFESARDFAQASRHFSIAAENAMKVFAYHEAELLARRGLRALEATADTPVRMQIELDLQLKLGMPLLATKGYGNLEVEQIFNRAHELCIQLGENPRLFSALWGLQAYYVARLEIPEAKGIADQLLRLAQNSQDDAVLLATHFLVGASCYCSGEFEAALEHFRYVRSVDDAAIRVSSARRYGLEPGILMRAFEARVLCWSGHLDQCLVPAEESLALARSLAHAPTLELVMGLAAATRQFRGDVDHVDILGREMMRQGTEHGLGLWIAEGSFFTGWVRAQQENDTSPGLELMRQSLAAYRATGTELFLPHGYAVLAQSLGISGRFEEGLEIVRDALKLPCLNLPYPTFYTAELLRVEGELLAALGDTDGAETRLLRSLEVARGQKARTCELRTATSLTRLWRTSGRTSLAGDVLTPIYQWFSEGLETPDVRAAREEVQGLGTA